MTSEVVMVTTETGIMMRVTIRTMRGLRGWWLWVIALVWPSRTSAGVCGNRAWQTAMLGTLEVSLTLRETSVSDGYSREELLEMLQTVRRHEKIQGWKVPEPSDE